MKAAQIIIGVLDILVSIALIVLVLLQDSKSKGLGSLAGGASDTFFSKTKGRTREAMLKKLTSVMAIAFAILTMVLYLLTGRGI